MLIMKPLPYTDDESPYIAGVILRPHNTAAFKFQCVWVEMGHICLYDDLVA